jgi:hypothetical protein
MAFWLLATLSRMAGWMLDSSSNARGMAHSSQFADG